MDFVYLFNGFELILWTTIGLFLLSGRLRSQSRIREVTAGITFLAFAISEAIEMQTGAWWKPVGLLALKAGCIVTLATIGVIHHRATRTPDSDSDKIRADEDGPHDQSTLPVD